MKITKIFMAAMLPAFALTACDDISEADRLIEVPAPVVARTVLVEEFSGQECVNCPNAAATLHDLVQQYGEDNFVVVTIHGGVMTWNTNTFGALGLGNDYADKLDEANGKPVSKPYMVVDRSGGTHNDVSKWGTVLSTAVAKTTPLTLSVSTAYDEQEGEYTVTVTGTAGDNVSGSLLVWLTESNVKAPQITVTGGYDQNYIHNHILRRSINGDNGEDFVVAWESGSSQPVTKTCKLKASDISGKYVAENCHVVAFVYNNSGVLQAATTSLVPDNADEGGAEDNGGQN